MSLIQGIDSGKEHRKHHREYLYRRFYSLSCVDHNPKHNQCPWCRDNRLHRSNVKLEATDDMLKEIELIESDGFDI